jgi:tetratricopeptide (TPR) repeat protein
METIHSQNQQAQAAYEAGQYNKAALLYENNASILFGAGDILTAAEMANNSSVAYLQAGEINDSLRMVTGTADIFFEAGDNKRHAMALGNHASALEASGKLHDALDMYQSSAALLKEKNEIELYTHVLKRISSLQLRTGSHLGAVASMQSALNNSKTLSMREKLIKNLLRLPFRLQR